MFPVLRGEEGQKIENKRGTMRINILKISKKQMWELKFKNKM